MFDADDPALDESEGPGQPNLDLEEAGNGDQVDSAVGTRNGTAAASLTAGMLLGPRLTLERRRQRVRQTGSQQQARTTMPTGFRVPTPKTSSRYSQQALLEEVRVHTQSTLEQIAASGKFLDLELGIECPDGEVTKAMARFDSGSNLDVIDPRVATVLKKHKIHWGHDVVPTRSVIHRSL